MDGLTNILGQIATAKRDKRDLKDNALRAISIALSETSIYYRDLSIGKLRDLEKEAQLSRFWSAAAIPLRHFNEELAGMCENKAEYWLNPSEWTSDQIKEFGIRLEDLRKAYRQMALPAFAKQNRFINK